jgi:hypothetical protein
MSEAVLGGLLSAVVAGVFGLISKRMELSRTGVVAKSVSAPLESQASIPVAPLSASTINYGAILRQIGILQFILNIVGFIVGYTMGATGASSESILVAVIMIGTIVLIAGFFWSGLTVEKSLRWKHLVLVAVGVGITTLVVNSIILQQPITLLGIGFAILQNSVSMGIGGLIANSLKR